MTTPQLFALLMPAFAVLFALGMAWIVTHLPEERKRLHKDHHRPTPERH
jgi:hypothetical protein